MAKTKFVWKGDEAITKVEKHVQQSLNTASSYWVRAAKKGLSRVGAIIRMRKSRTTGKSTPVRAASPKFTFPHKQTGHLRRNMAWDNDRKLVNRVGTNVEYGKYLELKYNRPWMSLTNMITIPKIKMILGRKMRA